MTANGDVHNLRDDGRTESDATHLRFRQNHPETSITCLSCGQTFAATSKLQIVEHYSEFRHLSYYANCLYCRGKVHRYSVSGDRIEIYHDCSRWRRKLDK